MISLGTCVFGVDDYKVSVGVEVNVVGAQIKEHFIPVLELLYQLEDGSSELQELVE